MNGRNATSGFSGIGICSVYLATVVSYVQHVALWAGTV